MKNKATIIFIIIMFIIVAGVTVYALFGTGNENDNKNSVSSSTGKISFNQAIGQKAPEFSLESIQGKKVNLSDYRGKNVVLFFNEGSMCYPSCWNQMAELGNDERFNSDEVASFSIVVDPKSEWERIVKENPNLNKANILFDTNKTVSSAYNVLSLASSMHKGSVPGHTYFLIDKEGVIRFTFDDPSMATRNEMLFSEISKLKSE